MEKKKEYTVIFLGETGVGKSTWINGIRNYVAYKSFDEAMAGGPLAWIPTFFKHTTREGETIEIKLNFPDENEYGEAGASQTKGPRTYVLEREDCKINLIDTPGIGDTELKDAVNMRAILSHIEKYKEIHAICILLKPNESRLNVWFKYCMKSILQYLHIDAVNNIKFCFTNTRATNYAPGDTLGILKQNLKELNIDFLNTKDSVIKSTFYFDNEAFRCLVLQKNGIEITENDTKLFGLSWDHSVDETNRFFDRIKELNGHSTSNIISINHARDLIIRLFRPLQEISAVINEATEKLENCKREASNFDLRKEDLKKQLFFKITDVKITPLENPITTCKHPDCVSRTSPDETGTTQPIYKQVCCDPCWLDKFGVSPESTNDYRLWFCSTMDYNGVCRKCKHSYKDHMHMLHKYEPFEKPIINDDILEKLGHNRSVFDSNIKILAETENLLEELENERHLITEASAYFSLFVKKYSLVLYNDSYGDFLKTMMTLEERNGQTSKLQKLQKEIKFYEETKQILEGAIKKADENNTADPMNPARVFIYEEDLYGMKHYGGKLRVQTS